MALNTAKCRKIFIYPTQNFWDKGPIVVVVVVAVVFLVKAHKSCHAPANRDKTNSWASCASSIDPLAKMVQGVHKTQILEHKLIKLSSHIQYLRGFTIFSTRTHDILVTARANGSVSPHWNTNPLGCSDHVPAHSSAGT